MIICMNIEQGHWVGLVQTPGGQYISTMGSNGLPARSDEYVLVALNARVDFEHVDLCLRGESQVINNAGVQQTH